MQTPDGPSTLRPPFDPVSALASDNAKRIWRAWGEYLSQFVWDHFVGVGFRYPVSVELARRAFLDRWIRRTARLAQRPLRSFHCVEQDPSGRAYHVHALVAGTAGLPVARLQRAWDSGFSRSSSMTRTAGHATT